MYLVDRYHWFPNHLVPMLYAVQPLMFVHLILVVNFLPFFTTFHLSNIWIRLNVNLNISNLIKAIISFYQNKNIVFRYLLVVENYIKQFRIIFIFYWMSSLAIFKPVFQYQHICFCFLIVFAFVEILVAIKFFSF